MHIKGRAVSPDRLLKIAQSAEVVHDRGQPMGKNVSELGFIDAGYNQNGFFDASLPRLDAFLQSGYAEGVAAGGGERSRHRRCSVAIGIGFYHRKYLDL